MDEIASQNFLANDSAASVQLIELSERLSELRLMDEGGEEDRAYAGVGEGVEEKQREDQ